MVIPDYQSIMLPMLELAADGEAYPIRRAREILEERFGLTEEEARERVPSGQQTTFHNRVSWARTYMSKAGLLEDPKRGFFRITEIGKQVLAERPARIDMAFLTRFDDFVRWRETCRKAKSPEPKDQRKNGLEDETRRGNVSEASQATPEEAFYWGFQTIREELAREILQSVKESPPDFFERLVVDLLVKMGYGGSHREAGEAIGGSGDQGIDGIIKEDVLGLDIIYVQAKRWEGVVSRPEVQTFAGALQGQRARKGVFITTSSFTKEAREYAKQIDTKLILIGGSELTDLMIEHGVGVTTVKSYEVKRIDSDYFSDE